MPRAALCLAALLAPAAASAQSVDSLYCQENRSMAVRGAVGAPLQFDLSLWTPDQQYFGVRGEAAPHGGGWV